MTPHRFKELICELFNESGYQVRTTKFMGDFGVDILLTKDNLKTAVHSKETWTNYKTVQDGAGQ